MGLLDYLWGDTEEQKEARLAATPFKTKDRHCTDAPCLALYLLALAAWVAVAVVAFMDGEPAQLLYPTDSAGNICGAGEYEGKPLMYMFDMSRCAGLASALHGCPTPSLCVAECPDIEWAYTEGKVAGVREFCYSMTDSEWADQSLEELVQLRLCPAYLVPQRPLFDRCLPRLVHGNGLSLASYEHNVSSAHNGTHSSHAVRFPATDEDAGLDIVSIHGLVTKSNLSRNSSELSITGIKDMIVDRIFNRKRRSIDDETSFKSNELNAHLFSDKNYEEYDTKEELNTTAWDTELERNNSKRDLTDAVDLELLVDGVEELRRMLDLQSLGEKLVWDLSVYWWILLLFLLMAFVLSLIWIGLLNCCAVAAVWVGILGSTVVLATALATYSYTEYTRLGREGGVQDDIFLTSTERMVAGVTSNPHVWLGLCVVFSCVAGLLCILLCCCFQRITIATEMIGEASRAIRAISCSLVFPLLPFLLHLALAAWFLLIASLLLSARVEQFHVINGCQEENCTSPATGRVYQSWDTCQPDTFSNCSTCPESACVFHKYGPRTLHLVLQWYNIFIFLWSVGIVSALGDVTIAGAVSHWYWTFKKPSDLPPNILRKSFKRTLKYHLGTLACGSFILAVVQLFRLMVEFINQKIRSATSNNKCGRGVLWCFRGCFFVLEKVVKYINRNAFIMTAMVGTGFWKSSQDAFHMITANIVRGFFVNQVTDFVMILGKMFVIGVTTVCFAAALNDPRVELHYNLVPILCVVLGSYHIANTCFSVYTVAVDTLFLCFLKDVEMNDGGWRKPYYMSKRLMKIMRYENI